MKDIDQTKLSALAPNTLRAETDPVCVSFYSNAKTYIAEANKPNPGGDFLTTLGVGVLTSVVTQGIVPPGLGSVGSVAASQTVSQTVRHGSGLVLQDLKSNERINAKIVEAAAKVGCPVTTAP
jgi:hypothetical protein